ncbi:hypothetical protein, partial [Gemmiger sp.]|uniref:hypothetical protein n=1 Tax=Gemmiger sp. TaxID=2049027 RepID=UPI0025BE4217
AAGAVLKPQGGNCAVLPQDSSLQSKVSCVPNRKTTGGTASPLAAAEKKTCRRAVILPLHNISSTTKMTKQTAEDRAFLIDKTSAA